MKGLKEKASPFLKNKQYKEAITILKQMINYVERRVNEGQEKGVDSWLYSSLVSIYRKQREIEQEYQVFERYASRPSKPGATHEAFTKEANMKIEQRRLFGVDGKGLCQSCHHHLVLEQNDLDEWLCSKCRRVRETAIKHRRLLQVLQALGLSMPDDVSREQINEAIILHRDMMRYIGDVWYLLTGGSYKSAIKIGEISRVGGVSFRMEASSPLPGFDHFVSSLFSDYPLFVRLATKERERTKYAIARLTPEQKADPYKYQHIVAGKPRLIEDEDFHIIVNKLRELYGQFIPRTNELLPKKPWWKFW